MGDYSSPSYVDMTGQVVSCDGGTTFRSQFVDNEGSYASLNGRDYGDVIGTALEPTRGGFKFAGWQRQDGTPVVRYEYNPGENGGSIGNWTQYYDLEIGESYTPIWADVVAPTISNVGVTNNFAQEQTVTIDASDANGIAKYYVGQTVPTTDNMNDLLASDGNSGSVSSDGTWYFATRDSEGNWTSTDKSFVRANITGIEESNCEISYVIAERGSTIPLPGITKTGYHANTWNCGSTWNATENAEISPVWEGNEYTLTLNTNGGSANTTAKVVYNQTYGNAVSAVPTRNGYTFAGWYTSASGGEQVTSSTVYTMADNSTIYAHWTANNYTLTYDANGGSVSGTSKTVTFDSAYGDLPTPTRTGYTFAGWYTSASGGSQVTASSTYTTVGNSTIYAHWTANNYTLTYDANGGSVSSTSKTVTYNSTYGTLLTPTKSGYMFDGWYTAASGGSQVTASSTYTTVGNSTIYAHWTVANFTLTFDANGGSVSSTSKTVTYNQAYGELPTPTRSKYTFDGWYTSASGGSQVTSSSIFSELNNITLYAHWHHEHTSSCYHQHTSSCYHQHSSWCYDTEQRTHSHDSSCYEEYLEHCGDCYFYMNDPDGRPMWKCRGCGHYWLLSDYPRLPEVGHNRWKTRLNCTKSYDYVDVLNCNRGGKLECSRTYDCGIY